jgi:hypothetical protein
LSTQWRIVWTVIVLVSGFLLWRYPEEVARDATIPAMLVALYGLWFWRRRR